MKTETFEKAQDLKFKIDEVTNLINEIGEDKKNGSVYQPLNFHPCSNETLRDDVKDFVLKFLRSRKTNLEKTFSNLK